MEQEITSTANPLVKELRNLATSKKARQENGCFLIETWRGIDTLLRHDSSQYQIEQLVISNDWVDDPLIKQALRRHPNLQTAVLAEFLFEKITDVKNSQGILGVIRHRPQPLSINPERGHYLLLDAIRDPGNLGTMIRSAVGAGYDGILLLNDCVEPFNPKVIRSTMGTFAYINIWNITWDDLTQIQKKGYELYAATGLGGDSLYETEFSEKTILIVGSEAHGVSDELMKISNKTVTIPLNPRCESLNAAIAASICMFHICHHTHHRSNE